MTPPKPLPPPFKPMRFTYHAAFSYSSTNERYVSRVLAALLPKGIKIFDYKTEEGNIAVAGHTIEYLERIYEYEAMLVFAFLSKAYADSKFTKDEWEAASRATKRKPRYLIPVLFDETLEETGMSVSSICLGGKLSAEDLAVRIEGAIRLPPPKPWWFYLSTEVKVAAAAVLLALIVALILIQPSRTKILSADANAQAITAHIANIGPKSATVVGQRLKFGALPIEEAELGIDNNRIAPVVHDVTLTTMEILTKCNDDGIRPNKHKVEGLLDQQPAKLVTLEVDIQESNDAPGRSTRQVVTLPAARLKPLVERLVSGRDTQCP